ncbi:hypothetical protein [Gynuella sunshinyii]|uniref:Uncharacterized protein n=1 Tax=Gynuella sunshinyii YC6258 TaxID=1445510 RepID=A0A0C5VS66_9GAMM|nr:hypothetical protein [Gynuella sunshinyii]AJQ97507.1 hypothetical Protein YC6258_05479 [Gynuella sunshinyii YC6258]
MSEQQRKATLTSTSNPRGQIISTSDDRSGRVKPKHLVVDSAQSMPKRNLEVMTLRNKYSGDTFQVHSHNFGPFHQVPMNKPREKGDQQPLSPRTQQSLSDKWHNFNQN